MFCLDQRNRKIVLWAPSDILMVFYVNLPIESGNFVHSKTPHPWRPEVISIIWTKCEWYYVIITVSLDYFLYKLFFNSCAIKLLIVQTEEKGYSLNFSHLPWSHWVNSNSNNHWQDVSRRRKRRVRAYV